MFGKNKNHAQEKINKVNELVMQITSNKGIDEKQYKEMRVAINCLAIEAATGGEIIDKKDTPYIKFNQPLPTMAELNQLRVLLNSLTQFEYENIFAASDDEDDLSVSPLKTMATVSIPEKSSLKEISKYCIGSNTAAYTEPLSGDDIMVISINATEARKRRNRNILIGASVFTVVTLASICVGVAVYKHTHKSSVDDDEIIDDDDIIDDDIDDLLTEEADELIIDDSDII